RSRESSCLCRTCHPLRITGPYERLSRNLLPPGGIRRDHGRASDHPTALGPALPSGPTPGRTELSTGCGPKRLALQGISTRTALTQDANTCSDGWNGRRADAVHLRHRVEPRADDSVCRERGLRGREDVF